MKTNTGLVEYAKAQLGKPYWFGTFGQISTEKLWTDKAKQYPKHYTAERKKKAVYGQCGVKVHDCAGLIKGYLWSTSNTDAAIYKADQDWSADTMYSKATVKGVIKTMPERPGVLVWKPGHIGVYIGDGKVIEARGFDYGVIQSNLAGSPFTHWLQHPNIYYTSAPQPSQNTQSIDSIARQVLAGQFGNDPERSQLLIKAGYDPKEVQAKVNEILRGMSKEPPATGRYITTASELNLRTGPDGEIIGAFLKGSKLNVESISGEWAKVTVSGYVSTKYITKDT